MKFVAIGRSQTLVKSITHLMDNGHDLLGIVTSTPAPEYQDSLTELIRISEDNELPFLKSTDSTAIVSFMDGLSKTPDIAVSVNHNAILKLEVIEKFPLGVLNAHGGELPRYRGNACQAWAIINGENRIGLCIHKMMPDELDSGDIIERDFFPIDADTYITECIAWIEDTTPILFERALKKLSVDSSYILEAQKDSRLVPMRCYPRTPIDGKIDWNLPSITIDRLIKASSHPFQGAFIFLNGTKTHIFGSTVVNFGQFCAIPGQIMELKSDSIIVATGSGALEVFDFRISNLDIQASELVKSLRSRFTDSHWSSNLGNNLSAAE